jgi:hypothetical protein
VWIDFKMLTEMLQLYYARVLELFYGTEFEELEEEAAATEFEEVAEKFFIMRAMMEGILVPASPPTTQRSNFTASTGMEHMLYARKLVKHGDAPTASRSEVEVGKDEYKKAYGAVEDDDESIEEQVVYEELEVEFYDARNGMK